MSQWIKKTRANYKLFTDHTRTSMGESKGSPRPESQETGFSLVCPLSSRVTFHRSLTFSAPLFTLLFTFYCKIRGFRLNPFTSLQFKIQSLCTRIWWEMWAGRQEAAASNSCFGLSSWETQLQPEGVWVWEHKSKVQLPLVRTELLETTGWQE